MADLDLFRWIPSSLAVNEAPTVQVIAYGDGYEARMALGINTNLPTYTLSFTEANTEVVAQMCAFLRGKNALERFRLLTADGVEVEVVARSWSARYGDGVGELTVELKQVAEL